MHRLNTTVTHPIAISHKRNKYREGQICQNNLSLHWVYLNKVMTAGDLENRARAFWQNERYGIPKLQTPSTIIKRASIKQILKQKKYET